MNGSAGYTTMSIATDTDAKYARYVYTFSFEGERE